MIVDLINKIFLKILFILLFIPTAVIWLLWIAFIPEANRIRYYAKIQEVAYPILLRILLINFIKHITRPAYLFWQSEISLRFNILFNKDFKHRKIKTYNPSTRYRAIVLVITFIGWIGLIALLGWAIVERFFVLIEDNNLDKISKLIKTEIRIDGAFLIAILGLPILYLIWIFRDRNALSSLENAKKETNLKDFQQLQLWICGITDLDSSKTENQDKINTLRIAACHQIKFFLDGHHGTSFIKPSFEILKAQLEPPEGLEKRLKSIPIELGERHEGVINRRRMRDVLNEWVVPKYIPHVRDVLLGENLSRLADKKIIWRDVCLINSELSKVCLPNVDLQHCKLYGMRFRECELQLIKLGFCNLEASVFIKCKLQKADFSVSQLTWANFKFSQLQGADFQYSHLNHADMGMAKLELANFDGSSCQGASFRNSCCIGVNFLDANLENANFAAADIRGANFEEADIRGANFTNVVWDQNTNFKNTEYDENTIFNNEELAYFIAAGVKKTNPSLFKLANLKTSKILMRVKHLIHEIPYLKK